MGEAIDPSYIQALEQDVKEKQNKINELSGYAASSMSQQNQDPNLIVFQLEMDNILERIEHLLKGHIIATNPETGDIEYNTPEDQSLIVLNEYGSQLIMNVISFYLNRNTILSHYQDYRIFEILFDLGNELADLMWINYEKMGMDSTEKRSRYPVLVLNILHTIESAYNRSLKGGERESLRSGRVVTQAINPGTPQQSRDPWYKKLSF